LYKLLKDHRKYFQYIKESISEAKERLSTMDLIKNISLYIIKKIITINSENESQIDKLFDKLFYLIIIDWKLDEISNLMSIIYDKNILSYEHLLGIIINIVIDNKINPDKKNKDEKNLF
jgi:hypothetical protein